jgi:uncharacterized protein
MLIEEMTPEDCRAMLRQQRQGFGRLACCFEDQPYVIPIHFCIDGEYAYSFSMAGQKVDWMRHNPRVCLEIDDIRSRDDWRSLVAFGLFEELPNTPAFRFERMRALELFQANAMWWQPGSIALEIDTHDSRGTVPIVYRIAIERLTGHRALPSIDASSSAPAGNWLGRLFRPSGARP